MKLMSPFRFGQVADGRVIHVLASHLTLLFQTAFLAVLCLWGLESRLESGIVTGWDDNEAPAPLKWTW